MVQGMGRIKVNGRTDGQTDDGEFNSPPSSLREAGDKNVACVNFSFNKAFYSPGDARYTCYRYPIY